MKLHIEGKTGFKYIRQVGWSDIRNTIGKLNPKLKKIIDAIDPNSKDFPLIQIGYAFGDSIMTNGKFVLLDTVEQILSIQENKLLQRWLNYIPVPFGIFLNKTCEVFFERSDQTIPLYTLAPGYIMGLFEILDGISGKSHSYMPWQVVGGARTIFMLPKINNDVNHKKLKREFNVTVPAPKSVLQQWGVFREIVNAQDSLNPWTNEILFLTTPWFEQLKGNNAAWSLLREYLFQEAWLRSSSFLERTFSFMWQQFSSATSKRRFKPRMYIVDTIRHLVSIAFGTVAAFAPAVNDLTCPLQQIKQAYIDGYQLKDYMPTLLEPCVLKPTSPMVYYSLGFPTLLEGQPEIENTRNTIADLREIKLLMTNMCEYCKKYLSHIKLIHDFLNDIEFEYFHKAVDRQDEIKCSDQVLIDDPRFNEITPFQQNQTFCSTGPFLNGCIRVKKTVIESH